MENNNQRFLKDYEYRVYRINHFAEKYGWKFIGHAKGMVFGNKEVLLRIHPEMLTIETELIHPHKGKTHLIRSGDFTMKLVERIFRNPRAHTPNAIKSQYKSGK